MTSVPDSPAHDVGHDDPAAGRDAATRVLDDDWLDDLLACVGDVEFLFWTCPVQHPRDPLRVTVRWQGRVATCQDCGRTNLVPPMAPPAC